MADISLTFNTDLPAVMNGMAGQLQSHLDANSAQLNEGLGREFLNITRENFIYGGGRPKSWPPLSPKYAKKVGHTQSYLIQSGRLINSFQMAASNTEARVWNDTLYAAVHQYGYKRIPARPYAPVIGDQLTAYAEYRLRQRGMDIVERLIRTFNRA